MTDYTAITPEQLDKLNQRLDAIEKKVGIEPQLQPAPSLCEAVESVLSDPLKRYFPLTSNVIKYLTDALTAERKRQGLVSTAVTLCYLYRGTLPSHAREALEELDAFEKEQK